VHLEVDAAAGGHLVLRAWDGAAPDGEPVVTRTPERTAASSALAVTGRAGVS